MNGKVLYKLLILLLLLSLHSVCLSQYIMLRSVLASGGGIMRSDNYQIIGTLSQVSIGEATNGIYKAYIGFWHSYIQTETSIELIGEKDLLEIYPVPSENTIHISFNSNEEGSAEICAYNYLGLPVTDNIVNKVLPGKNRLILDLRGYSLSNGLYYLRIKCGDKVVSGKFIIRK